jgi:hypothetical protein
VILFRGSHIDLLGNGKIGKTVLIIRELSGFRSSSEAIMITDPEKLRVIADRNRRIVKIANGNPKLTGTLT